MITTGCEGCCFFAENNRGRGCAIQQFCMSTDERLVVAPGYCRKCRSRKWAKKQGTTDIHELEKAVDKENRLSFELIVVFDEAQNTIDDLVYTLGATWYHEHATRVIIADISGFGDRDNIALQYLRTRDHKVPTIVDSSVEHELLSDRPETIRRVVKQVRSKFFMVIPCGFSLCNIDWLATNVQAANNRVIRWSFPSVVGSTVLVPKNSCNGLYITEPYRTLSRKAITQSYSDESDEPRDRSFLEQLDKEEQESDMCLTLSCTECGLI